MGNKDKQQRDAQVKPHFDRKGRRCNQDIEQGVEEYHVFKENGDDHATTLFVRGRQHKTVRS
jgi:hypothetical protein